ncbi:MAG: cyclic nucleotide-binding domain-containing protein [Anaerolineae bacterium]
MSVFELLRHIELFAELTPEQIEQIATLGQEKIYNARDIIILEGDPSDEVYVVCNGMVEVEVSQGVVPDVPGRLQVNPIVRLGRGQVFGEMGLIDRGARSATVRCAEDGSTLFAISRQAFLELCEGDHDIGYIVMRNIAADLSFKLRHRNLQMGLSGGGA